MRKREERRHKRVSRKWNRLGPKADACPECNEHELGLNDSLTHRWKRFFVECEHCHWCGKSRPTIRWAIRAWNKEGDKKYAEMLKRVYGGE